MSENEGNAAPEESGTSTEVSVENTQASAESQPKMFDEEYVKGLRNESAKHRTEKNETKTQLDEALARLKEFEDAKLSQEEKMQRDFDEYRTKAESSTRRAQETELKYQLALHAQKEGVTDLKAAVKLADRELIQFDESGNISNLGDVFENLRSEYPSVFASSAPKAPDLDATNPAKKRAPKKYTREDLAKLPQGEVSKLYQNGELNHLLGGGQ